MTDGFADRPPDDETDGGVGQDRDDGGAHGGTGIGHEGSESGHDDGGTDPEEEDGTDSGGDGTVHGDDEDDYDPSLAGVFGARPEDEPPRTELVPESPSLENALFLLLGVLLGGFVVYRAVTIFTA